MMTMIMHMISLKREFRTSRLKYDYPSKPSKADNMVATSEPLASPTLSKKLADLVLGNGNAEVEPTHECLLRQSPSCQYSVTVEKEKTMDDGDEEDDASSVESADNQTEWEYPLSDDCQYEIDARDEGTADRWIKRNPKLIRLTGKHPFNSEPPLSVLMQCGFLTATNLHYVRNHGYVPRADYEEWRVEVSGTVLRPQSFTMKQLIEDFPSHELPVTLVCAGNRRKEQNMTKQTIGFNWGPGAISTSISRGARLCDVLKRCGIKRKISKLGKELFVCFEGAETLPAGGGSYYGTSVSLQVALDESRDILVAYMQNGRPLEPDHGFPVRMIIPGYIGGRMVKWLRRICIKDRESQSHYHFKDNRVLPAHVDADKANAEDWWSKPEYLINELNVNSVITSPAHGEVVPITLQTPYVVRGYAYSGGGRKVIRVEVSTDDARSWKDARVIHTEKPSRYGKYWCWCFWELPLDVVELLQCTEMVVRAWDSAMNTQPHTLTWNVLGMMNNCWYRVKIHVCNVMSGTSTVGLAFAHPTVPGNKIGGWMQPPASEEINRERTESDAMKAILGRSQSTPVLSSRGHTRIISDSELKQHNTAESPWIVVHDTVYDCTNFLKDHPGGKDSILINAGTDCTEEFDSIHSSKANAMLNDYKIGEFESFSEHIMSVDSTPGAKQAWNQVASNSAENQVILSLTSQNSQLRSISASAPLALDPRKRIPCKLIAKQLLSHDVRLFRFSLQREDQMLGLPCGKHVFIAAKIGGKLCMRAYTPVSTDKEVGFFDLLVKIYFKGVNRSFPQGGMMSQPLDSLQIGEMIDVKGPLGHIHYLGKGFCEIDEKRFHMNVCAMLAGGTGITPMYQLIRKVLDDPDDLTQIFLIYANRTEEDIMLRKELDKLAEENPSQFQLWYMLSSPPQDHDWEYGTGRINEEVIKAHFPPPFLEPTIFLCGPPPMLHEACYPNLTKLGYTTGSIFEF